MSKIKQIVQQVANSLGYRISKVRQPAEYHFIDLLELVVRDYIQKSPDFFFVQFGAHDGQSSDPIHGMVKQHHWRGLLVEPQPQAFEQLQATYQDEPQLSFENAAISKEDGIATLYAVRQQETALPYWFYQIASLDREVVLGVLRQWKYTQNETAIPDDIESFIEERSIPALAVTTLLEKHQINKIDLLVIDTMGYDFEILKTFPFHLLKPAIIHFEHNHLSSEDQTACLKYLTNLGYALGRVAVDTIAYLNAPTRTWTVENW